MTAFSPERQHPRYAIELECQIRRAGAGGTATIHGRSRNLSLSGVSCIVLEPIEISTMVEMEIALFFGGNSFSEPLRIDATIVWCTRVSGGYQIGAKFANVRAPLRDCLTLFTEYLKT